MGEEIVVPALWLPVAAAFIPLLAALVVRPEAANRARAGVAVVAAVALAVLEVATSGDPFTVACLVSAALLALASNLTAYLSVWKHANVNDLPGGLGKDPWASLGKGPMYSTAQKEAGIV